MGTIMKKCKTCDNMFKASKTEHKRGYAKYCSLNCSNKHPRKKIVKPPNVKCAYCQKEFYKSPCKQKQSKSGLFFCCRAHKDKAQRIGGIENIQPKHYKNGAYSYRKLAFRKLPHKCSTCGFDKYPEVLEVHHINGDRNNNDISNLTILCPTCHKITHLLQRKRVSIKPTLQTTQF